MTNSERIARREGSLTDAEIVGLAHGNHIWLNAFCLVRPTEEFKARLGEMVIKKLEESEIIDDLIGRTKVAFIRVNAS